MPTNVGFYAKLNAAVSTNNSLLCVGLDPNPDQVPERYRSLSSDPFDSILAWNRAIIEDTYDLVCAYKPNIAFYEALGSTGIDILSQTIALIPDHIPVILDAKRGDIGNTASAYARTCFEHLKADAVTVSPYLGRDSIEPFASYGDRGLFVLCRTSNPGSRDFQELEVSDWHALDSQPNFPLFVHVARTAVSWSSNIGLVVGATFPTAIQQVREIAPGTWFLVPGIGAQGGDLSSTVAAGLRDDASGIIVNASRGVSLSDNHRHAALTLRDTINQVRDTRREFSPSGLPFHSAAPDTPYSQRKLMSELVALEAVKFGDFELASGLRSPIYIDLRLLVSKPRLLSDVSETYALLLGELQYDRIAGVPYAALPIGTAVAIAVDRPMIYPRKEAKAYGLGKEIEGHWQVGDRVVIIEDLITSGGSTLQTATRLRDAGLIVEHAVVLIDREQGGAENLASAGITVHSVFTLSSMLDILTQAGELDPQQADEVIEFIRSQNST